ncbi:MAG: methyltransferase domain-containing protein [Nannocystaceae bacterium]
MDGVTPLELHRSSLVARARAELVTQLGWDRRRCPICGWVGRRFRSYGTSMRRGDARCPRCGSAERHRLAYRLLAGVLGAQRQALHVAPEAALRPWIEGLSRRYRAIDLDRPGCERMDLTALALADASCSLVWCSHVLEHIPDDRRAIAEIARVLEPGGLAVIQVPIGGAVTDEVAIADPDERARRYWQRDHVRLYGLDLRERLAAAGLVVDVLGVDALAPATVARERLSMRGCDELFVARKPAS